MEVWRNCNCQQERYARLAETYHFHWMFYDVMAQPEMREMFQRRIDYDRWVGGKFKWPIPIREFWMILPPGTLKYLYI